MCTSALVLLLVALSPMAIEGLETQALKDLIRKTSSSAAASSLLVDLGTDTSPTLAPSYPQGCVDTVSAEDRIWSFKVASNLNLGGVKIAPFEDVTAFENIPVKDSIYDRTTKKLRDGEFHLPYAEFAQDIIYINNVTMGGTEAEPLLTARMNGTSITVMGIELQLTWIVTFFWNEAWGSAPVMYKGGPTSVSANIPAFEEVQYETVAARIAVADAGLMNLLMPDACEVAENTDVKFESMYMYLANGYFVDYSAPQVNLPVDMGLSIGGSVLINEGVLAETAVVMDSVRLGASMTWIGLDNSTEYASGATSLKEMTKVYTLYAKLGGLDGILKSGTANFTVTSDPKLPAGDRLTVGVLRVDAEARKYYDNLRRLE